MIVGFLPRVRYVIFTDRLLEELPPDEVDAVFGHEVGHAKHGHLWHYAAFLLLSVVVLAALGLFIDQRLAAAGVPLPEGAENWIALAPLGLLAAYLFVVWGHLSRRCERQADVYGCRAVSCRDPGCTGHDSTTAYPEHARGLCPTGIRTFVRALERVDEMNGARRTAGDRRPGIGVMLRGVFGWLRAWQHSTMPRRIAFLLSLIGDPARERRFQLRVALLRWGLIVGLTAALVALGEAVSWHKFLTVL
jgi:Zn-dependent protease with chaperone function